MNLIVQKFTKFKLIILSGFFAVPSIPEGDMMCLSTSIPRFDANDEPMYVGPPQPSFSFDHWIAFAESSTIPLAEATLKRHQRFKDAEGNGLDEQSLGMLRFLLSDFVSTPMPLPKT